MISGENRSQLMRSEGSQGDAKKPEDARDLSGQLHRRKSSGRVPNIQLLSGGAEIPRWLSGRRSKAGNLCPKLFAPEDATR